MPKISIRGNEMPASPIRKLAPLADEAKARGILCYAVVFCLFYFYLRAVRLDRRVCPCITPSFPSN